MAEEIRNPAKAIRAFCLECCGGRSSDVRDCTSSRCPLKPFRFGKNPYRAKRVLTDEQKAAARERLRKAREEASE